MKSITVIGTSCGDEGKGAIVDRLCARAINPLVIRFCGGHQAGHHVVLNEQIDHVFSNFGSGTLRGFDTYWSPYCTVDPTGLLNELDVLLSLPINLGPTIYIDANCPVTTPMDKRANVLMEEKEGHGTCGVGFGQTLQREEDHYSLLFSDLFTPFVLEMKYSLIEKYYLNDRNVPGSEDLGHSSSEFLQDCWAVEVSPNIKMTYGFPAGDYTEYIFEGSQGLMLDQNFGFFPHVTRSNTGSKNILAMGHRPDIVLVTRAYQTRHGTGPMTNTTSRMKPNPYEKQEEDKFQGEFRTGILDLDLIKYAINRDDYIRESRKSLAITCMDIVEDAWIFIREGQVLKYKTEEEFTRAIGDFLGIERSVFVTHFPIVPKPPLELGSVWRWF